MSNCPLCGAGTPGRPAEICPHHLRAEGEGREWSTRNRIMCDFVHRGIQPPDNDVSLGLVASASGEYVSAARVYARAYGYQEED